MSEARRIVLVTQEIGQQAVRIDVMSRLMVRNMRQPLPMPPSESLTRRVWLTGARKLSWDVLQSGHGTASTLGSDATAKVAVCPPKLHSHWLPSKLMRDRS